MKWLPLGVLLLPRCLGSSVGRRGVMASYFLSSSMRAMNRMPLTTLSDDFSKSTLQVDPASPIHYFEEVGSTMDTAKELVANGEKELLFTVVADTQRNARGTHGRKWVCGEHNVLMTIALHRDLVRIPIHLLPLRVGTLIALAIGQWVTDPESKVTLKWPNDILINGEKTCGVLIEMQGDHLIIGIGVNVFSAPDVSAVGQDSGRPATALLRHNAQLRQKQLQRSVAAVLQKSDEQGNSGATQSVGEHRRIARDIVIQVEQWLAASDSAARVVADFSAQLELSSQRLRDECNPERQIVTPLRVNADGTLLVRFANGSEESLVTDYLW